jgi:hypothetical protein
MRRPSCSAILGISVRSLLLRDEAIGEQLWSVALRQESIAEKLMRASLLRLRTRSTRPASLVCGKGASLR